MPGSSTIGEPLNRGIQMFPSHDSGPAPAEGPWHRLRTKRVYDPPLPEDGARVLVDRLWPRGLSMRRATLTLWLKEIAPSTELRQWFDHDPVRWAEFADRYRAELRANSAAVGQLRKILQSCPVTLLYAAHDTEHAHAIVLADFILGHEGNDDAGNAS